MTDIPDDIMKTAREVVISERTGLNLAGRIKRGKADDVWPIMQIARALLATEDRVREECAKIAEADAASRSEMEGYGTAKSAGHRIAAAILEGIKC